MSEDRYPEMRPYDHQKAMAFQTEVIYLAEAAGINILELDGALEPIVAVCRSIVKTSLKEASEAASEKPDLSPVRAGLGL